MDYIEDLEEGYEWKLLLEGEKPPYNVSLERLERAEVDNNNTHPIYSHLKVIDIVYSVVRKSNAEITRLIENAENNANELLISHTDRLKFMFLYIAVVHRKLNGDPINAKMQEIL